MPKRTLLLVLVVIAGAAGVAFAIQAQHPPVSPVVAQVAPYPYPVGADTSEQEAAAEREAIATKLARRPDSPPLLAQMAGAELGAGNLDAARELAERSYAIRPNNGARMVLAKIAESIHLFDRAIVLAQAVAETEKDPTGAHVILCTAYVATGRPHDAVPLADGLVRRLPLAGAFLQRALVYEAVGRNAEAELDYVEALRREPATDPAHSARARMLYGRYCMRQRRWADAEALLSVAVELEVWNGSARAMLAETCAALGQHDRATIEFHLAYERGGEPPTLVAWARCTQSQAKRAELLAKAEAALEHGHEHHHRHHDHRNGHAQSNRDGHSHGASALAHATGHVNRDTAELLLTRLAEGDAAHARDRMLDELAIRRDWYTLLLLARAHLAGGDAKDAQAAMQQVLATGIRNPDVFDVAAKIASALDRAQQAALYRALADERAAIPRAP